MIQFSLQHEQHTYYYSDCHTDRHKKILVYTSQQEVISQKYIIYAKILITNRMIMVAAI